MLTDQDDSYHNFDNKTNNNNGRSKWMDTSSLITAKRDKDTGIKKVSTIY